MRPLYWKIDRTNEHTITKLFLVTTNKNYYSLYLIKKPMLIAQAFSQ